MQQGQRQQPQGQLLKALPLLIKPLKGMLKLQLEASRCASLDAVCMLVATERHMLCC